VFFSRVCREKGANIVLSAAGLLPDIRFDVYGPIEDSFKAEFISGISDLPNVSYNGTFPSSGENIYAKLNEYDVLLLPTRWFAEGIPGILVESKIAALPAIVSNVAYNGEIITDGVNGIVLPENNAHELTVAIRRLDESRALLKVMKLAAKADADRYYIEKYIDGIIETLVEKV
jgi:glycosyltransferase involved in cell wall biosynthesis